MIEYFVLGQKVKRFEWIRPEEEEKMVSKGANSKGAAARWFGARPACSYYQNNGSAGNF